MEAALVINVSNDEHKHYNGLSGIFVVPPKPPGMEFGLLVVYPTPEIQDIGDGRKDIHWPKVRKIAADVVGSSSDAAQMMQDGQRSFLGVLLCEAEPELPKSLMKAIEDEIEFLSNDENRPEIRQVRGKGGLVVAQNRYPAGVPEKMIEMGKIITRERDAFHAHCRTQVTREEVARATKNLVTEYGRLVSEADMMWARPNEQVNISDRHRRACRYLHQERPWCYTPKQLVDCPGCGTAIKVGVIVCMACGALIEEPIEFYATLSAKEKRQLLYPQQDAEAPSVPQQVKRRQ